VTGRDVPDGDMPNLPWPKHRDEPVTGDPSLADLLAWAEFTPSSAPELKPVAEVLAALTAGPADDELAGEAAALAAYRNRGDVPRPAPRTHRRRSPLFPFLSARAVATVAAAAAVLGIGAFATAAYTQALPAPVQRLAHVIIGAPTAGDGPATGPAPAGSGATGPGSAGRAGGTPTGKAQPSPTPHASGQSTPQGSGQPSTAPTPSDSGTPTPTPTPTKSKGKPSTHPTNGNGNGGGNGNGNGNGNSDSTPTPQP
jgi:hypothetical protein